MCSHKVAEGRPADQRREAPVPGPMLLVNTPTAFAMLISKEGVKAEEGGSEVVPMWQVENVSTSVTLLVDRLGVLPVL